jgi:hypothetical protein
MALFRVQFDGPELAEPQADGDAAGAEFEGSLGFADNVRFRHHFLLKRRTPEEAIDAMSRAVKQRAEFNNFAASEVTPPAGWKGLGGDIDWTHVASRCDLTELEKVLLAKLLDAAEPTWILLEDPHTGGDREAVEAAFRDLELRSLVTRTREPSGNPAGGVMDPEDWWTLTDQAWDLLGLIKPPWHS